MAMAKDVLSAAALTATGSARTDALELTAQVNNVTTAAASTGVRLPSNAAAGAQIYVRNGGANALAVYPATATGTVAGGGAGAAYSLAVTDNSTRSRMFICFGNDLWHTCGVI